MTAREKLIVGLDVPTVQQAEDIVSKIGDEVLFYRSVISWFSQAVSNSRVTLSRAARRSF